MAIIAKPAVADVNVFVITSRRETRVFGMKCASRRNRSLVYVVKQDTNITLEVPRPWMRLVAESRQRDAS